MKTLHLTSPHIHGSRVERLQKRLKLNWTGTDFLQGGIDGDFGPETARACIRAKFWLGYPSTERKPVAGELLFKLLASKKALTHEFAVRRQRRLKAKARTPLRVKALARAREDIGMKEKPKNSNLSPISRRWGVQGPWCAMGISEWYIDVGSKAFRLHRDYAYVPFLLAAAEQGNHGLAIVRAAVVMPGDPVAFDWDDDGVADHVGLFDHWLEKGQRFATVEANTAIGNDSNGGEVMPRERSISDVATYQRAPAFVRVGR